MTIFPNELLKNWFLQLRRSLPWRDQPTPYKVWISEIMLQQTQVSVVIPYFEKWMIHFPTIHDLAAAPIEHVLKLWEGLGYYSRARNIHEGARYLVREYGGVIPEDPEKLSAIKGIGPYTLGAILNFAFHKKAAAVDGNVERVLSRFFALEVASRKEIEKRVEEFLPDVEPWIVSEGMIELGALICAKKPKCSICPLSEHCLAHQQSRELEFPKGKKQTPITQLVRFVAVIRHGQQYLLKKGEKGEIMEDLYEFPFVEYQEGKPAKQIFEAHFGITLREIAPLPEERHSFTRYRVRLIPYLFEAKEFNSLLSWVDQDEVKKLPFSSGHRRILNQLLKEVS